MGPRSALFAVEQRSRQNRVAWSEGASSNSSSSSSSGGRGGRGGGQVIEGHVRCASGAGLVVASGNVRTEEKRDCDVEVSGERTRWRSERDGEVKDG